MTPAIRLRTCNDPTTRRTQTSRRQALIAVELAYAFLSIAAAVALLFSLGPVAKATNLTSVRILGAALLAFAMGALAVARDPVRNRAMLQVEIVFTALCAMLLVWRLVVDGSQMRTWLLLVPLTAGLTLLLWLYPASGPGVNREGR